MQYLPRDETLVERLDSIRRTLDNEPLFGQVAPLIIQDFLQQRDLDGRFAAAFQDIARMNEHADAVVGCTNPNYAQLAEQFFKRFAAVVRPTRFVESTYIDFRKPFRGYGSLMRQFRTGLLVGGAALALVFVILPTATRSFADAIELLQHFGWLMAVMLAALALAIAFNERREKRLELDARKYAAQELLKQLRFIDDNTPKPPELRSAA